MLNKIHTILITFMSIFDIFKNTIIQSKIQEATPFVGQKVNLHTLDGGRIDGTLQQINEANHTLQLEVTLKVNLRSTDSEPQTEIIDVPIFNVADISEFVDYSEMEDRAIPLFEKWQHPLTGKKVEITTQISRYTGILQDATSFNSVALETDDEGTIYLSGDYTMKEIR